MIELYALTYFHLLLRQNVTNPPQTPSQWVYFAVITVLSILLGGGVLAAWLKNWTDDQSLKNEEARAKLARESQQDTAVAGILKPLVDLLARSTDNQSKANEILEAIDARASANEERQSRERNEATLKQEGRLSLMTTQIVEFGQKNESGLGEVQKQLKEALERLEKIQVVMTEVATSAAMLKGVEELKTEFVKVIESVNMLVRQIEAMTPKPPPADSIPVITPITETPQL